MSKKREFLGAPMTSLPPAARSASCLAEGGDGADGWVDAKSDKKALGKTRESGERPWFTPSVGR